MADAAGFGVQVVRGVTGSGGIQDCHHLEPASEKIFGALAMLCTIIIIDAM